VRRASSRTSHRRRAVSLRVPDHGDCADHE
jgi:hypothetical protein